MTDTYLEQTIVGESAPIRRLRDLISRVAPLDLPVLIEGPTGSGKELVAHALHRTSGRAGRCVPVNVCAIPATMFEDTLFGHVRGAFTGASATSRGYLAEADAGTLFLDEISGLPMHLQATFLRFIETGSFRPVGGQRDRRSVFRVVAATNESVDRLISEGRFRRDLAHRLRGITLSVPPLRDRSEDIPLLVSHFLRNVVDVGGDARFSAAAVRMLKRHEWPGNVRELRHTVERAVALSTGATIGQVELRTALRLGSGQPSSRPAAPFARRRLIRVLERCEWDTARAASLLDVHRSTIYRRMRRWGISRPDSARSDGGPTSAQHSA